MRSYPSNSPEAAARIVALVLISDGHACNSEFEALREADVARSLGLSPQDFHSIVQTLCEDLLMEGFNGGSILSYVDDGSLASLLAEVDQPELRSRVLRVAASAVHADAHLADGEALVLDAIARHWGLCALAVAAKPGIAGVVPEPPHAAAPRLSLPGVPRVGRA
ncbi:MAG: TerB family tellurite resistance protein [Sphaerotilus sulfidivorans]|uniref:TerB family tellurite resistance protein n=1 Tax=Sphaerotilus sulfidivorans TaxID=639200 RepID=UPI003F3FC669